METKGNLMIRTFHAIHDDERGMALVVSLMVAFVVLMLSTIVVAQSIHSLDASGLDRRRLTAVNAAEAGTAAWWEDLQTTPLSSLDCTTKTETLKSGPSEATFTADATFYAADGTTPMDCSTFTNEVYPEYVKVASTGTSEGGVPREMETFARLTPIYTGTGSAIMSNNGASFVNNFDVYGLNGNDGNVYVLTGNLSIGNSTEIRGNVYVPNGSATLSNSSHIYGGLWTLNGISMSNSARVDGDLRTNSGPANGSNSASVGGDAYSGSTIGAGLAVGGTRYPNYTLPAVPTQTYPTFTYDPADWADYTISTFTDCTTARNFLTGGSWSGNRVVRIASSCALTFSNNTTINIPGDLAIISDGTIAMANKTTWKGTAGSVKRLMFLKPVGTACGSPAFSEQNNTDYLNANVVIYVPPTCPVTMSNQNQLKGQVYGGTVAINNNFTMTYTPVLVPGLGTDIAGFHQDISYVREV
jgi:Tfp pilus assembly protein PilX